MRGNGILHRKFATLDDVARACGLSRAQVSRALGGKAGVTPETRQRIQDMAAQIGYTPNQAARSLALVKSKNIGLMIGEPLSPFQMLLAQQIDIALAEVGYDAVVSLRAYHQGPVLSEAGRLRSLRVAGIICISTPHEDSSISKIADLIPCVYVGKDVSDERVSTVMGADRAGVKKMVEHLLSIGHQRIAFITGGTSPGSDRRYEGYRDAMVDASLQTKKVIGGAILLDGKNGVHQLLEGDFNPTAILTHNDIVAMGAIAGLQERGLRVPDDVSVVGFDDIPYASSETLSLTTLRQDTTEQARAAVAAMLYRLGEGEAVPRSQVLPVHLCLRRSSGPVTKS